MEWVFDLVLTGGCLLVLYFNKRYTWAMPGAIACFVAGGIAFFLQMPRSGPRPPERPMPRVEDARKKFNESAITATADVLYHGAGFSIQVPQGFRYAKMEDPMLLVASRVDVGTAFIVFRHELGHDDPEPTVRESIDLLKKGNSSYEFSPLKVDAQSQWSTWFKVTKNGVPLRGLLVFAERDDKLWELTVTEPAGEQDATLYRIAQTWNVD